MERFELFMPTRIYFGKDRVPEAVSREQDLLGERTLVITGNAPERLGFSGVLKNSLEKVLGSGNMVWYKGISPNPDIEEIAEAVRLGKEFRVSSVIGFGGGSAIDAAKAAAVGIPTDIPVQDFLLKGLVPGAETLPVIAIPTTAGTGAELTKGAIISCRARGIKAGIRGENITPRVAVVDPSFTYSVPYDVTMETGFDVFAHASESYLAVKADWFSDMLSEKAIRGAACCLRRLACDLNDREARDRMSFLSLLMGFNIRNVGNCLPHRMQYPVGARTRTSHGAGLSALYPAWFSHEFMVHPERLNHILEWLGYRKAGNGEEAASFFREFLSDLNVSRTLSDLGIGEADVAELAGEVSGNLKNDRLSDVNGIVETIYRESL